MKSNLRNPIWPYLLVLGCLFVLSIAAPRSWNRDIADRRVMRKPAGDARKNPRDQAVILRAEPSEATARIALPIERDDWAVQPRIESGSERIANPVAGGDVASSDTETGPADVAEQDFDPAVESQPVDPQHGPAARKATMPLRPPRASAREATTESVGPSGDQISEEELDEAGSDDAEPNYAHWPVIETLAERLARLKPHEECAAWTGSVTVLLDQLSQLSIEDPRSRNLLGELRSVAGNTRSYADRLPRHAYHELQLARLELLRRLDIWQRIDPQSSLLVQPVSADTAAVDASMQTTLDDIRELLSTSAAGETWRNYLMLNTLDRLAMLASEEAASERRRIGRLVLARLESSQLSGEQQRFLQQASLLSLRRQLSRWVAEPIELGRLLHAIESYESTRLPSEGRVLAEQISWLRWSHEAAQQKLGEQLGVQYRNANVRLVVTGDLMNRLLPDRAPQSDVVNEVVLGVPSHGYSTTSTQLFVRLLPDARKLRFAIEAAGQVDSQTASDAGPVTLYSNGASTYRVGKLVEIDGGGMRLGPALAVAENEMQLRGVETDFDAIPFVRSLVRSYALNEQRSKRGQAEREIEAKVATRAGQRFDAELAPRLAKAEAELRRRFLLPLEKLSLSPSVVALGTSNERLTMRLRLASDAQAGAHTPRPLARSDSLASFQVHESALNNVLERLDLAGRTFTLPELRTRLAKRLGRTPRRLSDDVPEDVTVTFADADAIQVWCEEGRIGLTLSIAEISSEERSWNDFLVTVYYRPKYQGLELEFVRDGTIEISGDGHRGKANVVLRGIFAKAFSRERTMKFAPAAATPNPKLSRLAFSSAVVENGWISVTVADQTAAASRTKSINRSAFGEPGGVSPPIAHR